MATMGFGELGFGAAGAAVSELQAKLRKLGFAAPNTGAFDAATRAALQQFQQRVGLSPDGTLGASTESALNQVLLEQQGQGGGGAAAPQPCPGRPWWQTGLMVVGGGALVLGALKLLQEASGDEAEGDGYARALEPGREAKDITPYSKRISGAGCARTPDDAAFIKAPRVEA